MLLASGVAIYWLALPIVLSKKASRIPGAPNVTVTYLPDGGHQGLTLDQVIPLYEAGVFRPLESDSHLSVMNHGGNQDRWFRFQIKNEANEQRQIVLDLIWRVYDRVQLYHLMPNKSWKVLYYGGNDVVDAERTPRWRAFDLKIPAEDEIIFYLCARDFYRLPTQFFIWNNVNDFILWERFEYVKNFFVFGLSFGLITVGIFRYAIINKKEQLHYLLFITCFSLFFLVNSGFMMTMFPSLRSPMIEMMTALSFIMTMHQLCLFTRYFFNLNELEPKISFILNKIQGAWILSLASIPMLLYPSFTLSYILMLILLAIAVASFSFLIWISFRRWLAGSKEAILFLMGFSPVFFGFFFRLICYEDTVIRDDAQRLVVLICFILNLILLSFAMTYRKRMVLDSNYQLQLAYASDLELEVKNRTQELEDATHRLSVAIGQRDRILTIIGHDLRGPAISLHSLTSSINAGVNWTQDEITEWTSKISRTCFLQLELLNNLLTWGAMQFNHWKNAPDRLQLKEEADFVITSQREIALIKQLVLINNIRQESVVHVDSQLLQTVLRNLLANAIKFSNVGGRIIFYAQPIENGFIEVSIADEGVGINADLQKLLFKGKVESSAGTQSEKGIGIGLGICCDLINSVGGTIRVDRSSAQGTVICFTLPAFVPRENQSY